MSITSAHVFFAGTLVATFIAAWLGRRATTNRNGTGLGDQQRLNRWLIGLSAGATANSGFVVTAAVGIGYTQGLQWVMLPLSWLLGDIVFWTLFPARLNTTGKKQNAVTISELIASDFTSKTGLALKAFTGAIVIVCLSLYLSAQWISGEKFLAGAFDLPNLVSLVLFSLLIVAYTAIGDFRGSVYADSFQAVLRLFATILILVLVANAATSDVQGFKSNLLSAGPTFLSFWPPNAIGFVLGFACAGLGFSLGQPQIVSRYMAGADPQETQSAWWIYIGFVQFTWIGMTVFGVLLRGVMPNIGDPEAGLSIFFKDNFNGIVAGIIVADIFATVAATSNSILVAISQALVHDVIPLIGADRKKNHDVTIVTIAIGIGTMALSLILTGQHAVLNIVLSAVSILAASLAAPVMIKIMRWRSNEITLLVASSAGLFAAVGWKIAGLNSIINEAAPGILVGLLAHQIGLKLLGSR